MKYIKTFEDLITLDLEEKDLARVMDDAMTDQNVRLIKNLLENGFDPNCRVTSARPYVLGAAEKCFYNDYEKSLETVKLFIKFGANLNIIPYNTILEILLGKPIYNTSTLTAAAVQLKQVSEILIILIKSGARITEKFMTELNSIRKRRNIGKTAEELYHRIMNECAEEYERYELSIQTNKFNL